MAQQALYASWARPLGMIRGHFCCCRLIRSKQYLFIAAYPRQYLCLFVAPKGAGPQACAEVGERLCGFLAYFFPHLGVLFGKALPSTWLASRKRDHLAFD